MSNSFDLLKGGTDEKTKLWMTEVLLLFQRQVKGSEEKREFANFKYMECSRPRDDVDKVLGCIGLR